MINLIDQMLESLKENMLPNQPAINITNDVFAMEVSVLSQKGLKNVFKEEKYALEDDNTTDTSTIDDQSTYV